MTLDQVIDRYTNNAEYERIHGSLQGCLEFRQLAEWLKDYKRLLEQQTCEDAISRQEVLDQTYLWSKDEFLRVTNPFDYLRKRINSLPPVTPQQKYGKWILADEQNKEDVENDNYRFICSECQCSDIHAKGAIVPYCWKCGAKMQESEKI